MEIYLKITRDLSKQGTLQIGKEMIYFNKKCFHFFAIFLQDNKGDIKKFFVIRRIL